jgi:trimeric autotransporter adhesin
MHKAPYYLMVVAAGNDGEANYNEKPMNPSFPQYDKLAGFATSKNNLTIASSNDAEIYSDGRLKSVESSNSSSQGPTDDLRIKPDISGNGETVYSTSANKQGYATYSGTSTATPNVTGSLLLLQEHYKNLNGFFMKASTLKGLALHTADDFGDKGPDAISGWGLLNTKKAAETISKKGSSSLVMELTIS